MADGRLAPRLPTDAGRVRTIRGSEDDYAFEAGVGRLARLFSVADRAVAVRTRTGRLVTDAVPELAGLCR